MAVKIAYIFPSLLFLVCFPFIYRTFCQVCRSLPKSDSVQKIYTKDQESVTLWSIKQCKHKVENIIPAWAMESDTERRSRPVALAGDRCGLDQCLFGIELIKAHSHSSTAPITRSARCGRTGCYSGSLCFQAAECSWGHAVMVVCVLRKVSLAKGDHCHHASCIKFEGFISRRGALWCTLEFL